jgi:hypothetical protein
MSGIPDKEVTKFLDRLNHPFRNEIDKLRSLILQANSEIVENIKWNGPNYSFRNEDRITMRIQPPKQIQLIFHRGAKKLKQPSERLIKDESDLLTWKENDRAVITFRNITEIENAGNELNTIVNKWLNA